MVEDLDKMIALAREENNQTLVNDTLEAREHAFLIQVFVGRLLLEGKEEYGAKISAEFKAFSHSLDNMAKVLHSDDERKLHTELKELRTTYHKVFEQVRHDEEELGRLMDVEMPKFTALIISNAETLEHEASVHEHEVAKKAQAEILLAERELLIVAAVGTLLGLILALVLGRGIAGPVKDMTAAMTRLILVACWPTTCCPASRSACRVTWCCPTWLRLSVCTVRSSFGTLVRCGCWMTSRCSRARTRTR